MVAAGAISYEEALDVLVAVWRETERLGIRGGMGAVVGARREAVEGECAELRGRGLQVWIGNVNASTQFILTGSAEGVAAALEALRPRALSVFPLSMSWPIHSELMRPVAEAIAPMIASLRTIRDPDVPYYGPEGRAVRRRRGCPPTARHGVLFPDALEGHVRSDDGGGASSLSRGRDPATCSSKMVRWIDRSTRCDPGGHRRGDRGGRGYSRGRMKLA